MFASIPLKGKKKEHNHQQYWTASQNRYSNLNVLFFTIIGLSDTLLSLDNIRERYVLLVLSSCYGYVVVAKQNIYPSLHIPFLKKRKQVIFRIVLSSIKKKNALYLI